MGDSAGDWGKSNPLAVPEFIQEMKQRGHPESVIRTKIHDNPLAFFRQSVRWQEPGGEAVSGTPVREDRAEMTPGPGSQRDPRPAVGVGAGVARPADPRREPPPNFFL
jgi:hypothetical protein